MKRRSRGFTLVELLLAAALLVVMAAIVFPRMRDTVRSRGIAVHAEDFAQLVRYGRLEAVRLQREVVLNLSERGDACWLESAAGSAPDGPPDGGILDERLELSPSIRIDEVRRDGQRVAVRTYTFSPGGGGPRLSFRFRDAQERTKYVVLGPLVDQVWVVNKLEEAPGRESG